MMRKIKLNKLVALLLMVSIALTGCSSTVSNEGNEDKNVDKDSFVIGISQLADHPALDDARLGFEDGLKELGVDAKVIYQNAQGDIPTSLSIAQKFTKDKVDLIYAIATQAAQTARQATDEIPILFSAVTDPVKAEIVGDWDNVGGNITGTSDMAPVSSQLKMFKEIDPSINKIGILYNTSEPNSEIQLEDVKKLAPEEGLEVIAMGVSSINELPQTVDSLLNKVDAVYGLSDNLIASSIALVSKKLIEKNVISVFAEETQVKGGALITNGLSYYELGKQTAQMAKEILVDKKDVSTIPVGLAEKTVTIVNANTLKALNLDENMPIFKDAVRVGE